MGTYNPKIYEINFRVWIKKFVGKSSISDIPANNFRTLKDKGINLVWLMGLWETCPSVIEKCCFEVGLIQNYNQALPEWKKEDIIGSPFSINHYEINSDYGSWEDLKKLKEKLNKIGLKLILDFIPNHFSCDSILVKTNPEFFLQANEEIYKNDTHTYFKSEYHPDKFFAHGRDPLFPAWSDTIQINHFNESAREYLTDTLVRLTEVCDGVRCDMAMLQLNNVFKNTWLGVINKFNIQKPKEEFWKYAINKVRNKRKDFIFIAEAYWDLEWELQQLGFDYTYDKRLLDRLSSHDLLGVKNHLKAEMPYQLKSVRFIENHDEKRAVAKFGKQASMAAAVLMSTIPGMKLYFDGQFEGRKIKLPVQMGREPIEKESKTIKDFYERILEITKDKIFSNGNFQLLDTTQSSPNNFNNENMFAFLWRLKNEFRLAIINFSDSTSQCRIKIDLQTSLNKVTLEDVLNNLEFTRLISEIKNPGLYIELKGFGSHIFAFKLA